MKMIILCALIVLGVATGRAEDTLAEKLQKGLFEEEANHNLPAAIEHYKAVVAQTDQERKLAATALFRLGESYRKLGKEEEAKQVWARVLRDFSDQVELVKQIAEKSPAIANSDKSSGKSETSVSESSSFRELEQKLSASPDLLNAPTGPPGQTLLQEAVSAGNIPKTKYLIQRGADVNKSTPGTGAPLLVAASNGNKAVVELLLASGANVNGTDGQGETALHKAAERGYTQVSEALIAKGAEVNAKGKADVTPLWNAAGKAQVDEIALLVRHGANLESTTADGFTPLRAAIVTSQSTAVAMLLKLGANPNNSGGTEDTPLCLAAYQRNLDMVQLLLDAGANVDGTNGYGFTALGVSLNGNYPSASIAKLLLTHKADVNHADKEGQTPMHYAAKGPRRLIPILIENNANPNVKDLHGLTPLLYAVGGQSAIRPRARRLNGFVYPQNILTVNPEVVEPMLDGKADPNIPDGNGHTPLFFATASGNLEVVRLLLKAGADPNWKDIDGKTPLPFAPPRENQELEKLLLNAGAQDPDPPKKADVPTTTNPEPNPGK